MALKNVHTSTILDTTNPDWIDQAKFVAPAIDLTLTILLTNEDAWDTDGSVAALGSGRVDITGKGSNVKTLIKYKASDPTATFANFITGSNIANTILSEQFKCVLNEQMEILSGKPSTILSCDFALQVAIADPVEAPGLIIGAPEDPPIVALDFVLINPGPSFDLFNVVPLADIPDGIAGQINWTETPFDPMIPSFSSRTSADVFTGVPIDNVTDCSAPNLIGDWLYTSKDTLSDSASPAGNQVVFDTIIDAAAETISIKKDTSEVGTLTIGPTINGVTRLEHAIVIATIFGQENVSIISEIKDTKAGGMNGSLTKAYQELNGGVGFEQFESIARNLKITNNTGSTILAGTPLGQLLARRFTVMENGD